MIEHVYVDWGSGWVDLLDYSGVRLVRRSGLQKIQQIHDENCRIARNSVRFRITSNMTLVPHLMDNDEIAVQIEEGGAVWFRGYARPVTTFTDSNNDEVIDFEAFDESWLLEKALQDDELCENAYICDPSDTANSIVHQLLLSAGVASDDIEITTTISQQTTVNFEEGTKYLNAINDLLWDYHCVLSVTDGGKFWVYDWAPDAVPSASQTFDENNTIGELKVTKSDIDEDQVQVHYHQIIERNNITLCKKTYKNVPSNTLFKVLTTEVLHEWDEAREDAQAEDDQSAKNWPNSPGRFKFSNPVEGSEWLTSSNHSVSWHNRRFWNSVFVGIGAGGTTDNGEVSLASSAFGTTYADLQFNIDSPSKPWYASASWNTMRSVTIKGDAQFLKRHVNRTSLIPAGGNVLKEYKANYLYNDADAVALATAMANHLKHGKWHYEWKSQVEVAAGDYARIYNDTTLNIDRVVRIIKATWDEAQRIYSYKAIGVADLGTPVGSVTGEDVVVIAPGEIVDAIGRTTEGLDENGDLTRIVKSTTMPGEDEESVTGVTGLYMTRDFLGFYNGDESVDDWTARIKADGTFKFLGDADNYIEWDGAALLIQALLQSANYEEGSDGWQLKLNGNAELNDVTVRGGVEAISGEIGGWLIDSEALRSALTGEARIELNPTDNRVEVWGASGTEPRVAMGYLGGLTDPANRNNTLDSTVFGFWSAEGDAIEMHGDVKVTDGQYQLEDEASLEIIDSATGNSILRVGSVLGERGVHFYDDAGNLAASILWDDTDDVLTVDGDLAIAGGLSAGDGLLVAEGVQGEEGPQGPQGEKGDKPAHQWSDTSLQFENPDGSWGVETDLKGEAGIAATWTAGTYPQNAIVSYNSFLWRAKVETSGEPGVSSDWEKFVFTESSEELPLGTISFWDKSLEAKIQTQRCSGTRTDDSTYAVLVDDTATFNTDGVLPDDILWTDTDLPATVVSVDSETQITLDYDPSGLFSYTIYQQPDIQPGWTEIDGKTIDDPDSPFDGMSIVDVIGEERFIRARKTAGRLQSDTIRNITARTQFASDGNASNGVGPVDIEGAFYGSGNPSVEIGDKDGSRAGYLNLHFDASRVVPTAEENRPVNISAVPILKIKNSTQTKLATYYEITSDGTEFKNLQKLGTLEREDKLPVWDESSETYQHITAHDIENLVNVYDDVKIAHIQHRVSAGTNSGSTTANTWNTGPFNEVRTDTIGITLSSNQFTLPAGKYYIQAYHAIFYQNRFKSRLYNVTDGTTEIIGHSGYNDQGEGYNNDYPIVQGIIEITEPKTFEYQMYPQSGRGSTGWGYNTTTMEGSDDVWGNIYIQDIESMRGPQGNPPAHEWDGTTIRFEEPDGTWGSPRDLQAPSVVAQAWTSSETYETNDIVEHNGQLYISKADSNTEEPSGTAEDWEVYSYYEHVLDLVYYIGKKYWQLPGDGDPAEVGLPGTWENISTEFAGDFFRVEGGDALAFGDGQQLDQLQDHGHYVDRYTDDVNHSGGNGAYAIDPGRSHSPWVEEISDTDYGGGVPRRGTETRPVNQTIRIWERIS